MRSTLAGRLYSHLANEWDTTGPGQSPACLARPAGRRTNASLH